MSLRLFTFGGLVRYVLQMSRDGIIGDCQTPGYKGKKAECFSRVWEMIGGIIKASFLQSRHCEPLQQPGKYRILFYPQVLEQRQNTDCRMVDSEAVETREAPHAHLSSNGEVSIEVGIEHRSMTKQLKSRGPV